ncbi:MAG: purine and other phosphorylase-like protein, family 1 [Pseudomonadota bacterium]
MASRDGRAPAAAAREGAESPTRTAITPQALTLLCALPREAAALCNARLSIGRSQPLADQIAIFVSGPGPDAARDAVTALGRSTDGTPALLGFGVAGALTPDLVAGDVLLASELIDDSCSQVLALDPPPSSFRDRLQDGGLRLRTGTLVSTDTVVSTPQAKNALRERWRAASAVDMESAAYAREAQRLGMPFSTFRVIIDEADMAIPRAAASSLGADGETHLPTLLLRLLRDPAQLPALMRLGRAWRRAQASLHACGRLLSEPGHP